MTRIDDVRPLRPSAPRRRRVAHARIDRRVGVRMAVAGGVMTALFALIAYSAYGLQVKERDRYRRLAQRQQVQTVEIPAPRGAILDVKGRELAVTSDAHSIFANPREVVDLAGTAEALAALLDLDVRTLEARLASRRYFTWIERHVTPEEAEAVEQAKLGGVYVTREPRRRYPGDTLAGPVLGFAGIDGDGLDGIELKMDELLRGERARFAALRDASGRLMLSEGLVKPQPGATITLTIDRAIQYIAEHALRETVTAHKAKAGTIVVLDVATGEVLAMANAPGYDPNSPGRAVKANARNRGVTDTYEIGSVMKVFTVAAALDAGVVRPEDQFNVGGGKMTIGRKIIRDTYHDDVLTVGGILKRSSNVGAVKIAQKLGKQALYEALQRYGFGAATGIELPGERAGVIRDPKRWGDIGLASVSFGYGFMVSPLQIAAGMAAIGNRGEYHEPRIIREVVDASDTTVYRHQPQGRRMLSESTAAALLPMLASVFDKGPHGGTARSLEPSSFALGGKTGTARKVDPATREYSQKLYLSSFAGLAPIDEPRIAIVVVIDEPGGEHYYGGAVAGPAFVRVADETLRYLGMAPGKAAPVAEARPREHKDAAQTVEEESDLPALADMDDPLVLALDGPLPGDMIEIPDFTGMGIQRALDVARAAGISVEIEGSGRAVEQFPPPGPVPWPAECRIVFAPSRSSFKDPSREAAP